MTISIGPWDAELAWYSPGATQQIGLYGLEHSHRIRGFRLIWPCLIVKVHATWAKFLEPSGYCTVINSTFDFHTKNVFDCFCNVMARLEPLKHRLLNLTTLHNMSAHLTQWYYLRKQTSKHQNIAKLFHTLVFPVSTVQFSTSQHHYNEAHLTKVKILPDLGRDLLHPVTLLQPHRVLRISRRSWRRLSKRLEARTWHHIFII